MSSYKNIEIADFTYNLPDSKIALYPLQNRSESKLLLWKNGQIREEVFKNAASYLPENSILVFNNTRVINARLHFQKETGANIEIFCIEPVKPSEYELNFQETEKVTWKCMIGNAKKWKEGTLAKQVEIDGENIKLAANIISQNKNSFEIEFAWNGGFTFSQIIEYAGVLPIPPYLNRKTEQSDQKTYQTLYAKIDGSVASPTAGLHFTGEIFGRLSEKNIKTQEITLHVGAGTFQPLKTSNVLEHTMHREKVIIPKQFIETLAETKRKIIAVGTTSVRSIESLYWLGVQIENNTFSEDFHQVMQWEPYQNTSNIPVQKALKNLVCFLDETGKNELQFSTQIIIIPGYEFKIVNGMFTNFHQPQSTLLLLIGAFIGNEWKKAYNFALANNFRFLSYGDSNLYLKE
ncbi:MAG: S-adenosylmethionine:tRNA ribosyltransferase-isomerase [Bacteroidales bacterium]|nr:S-adenosylmethionine:tRNA ribosyltransferase-isomerase [Bacteroidales bacterium]